MFVQNHHSLEELQRLSQSPHQETDLAASSSRRAGQAGPFRPRDRPGLGMLSPRRSGLGRPLQPGGAGGPPGAAPHRTPAPPGRGEMCRGSVTASRPGPPPRTGVGTFRCAGLVVQLFDKIPATLMLRIEIRQLARQAIYDLLHRLRLQQPDAPAPA